MSPGPDIFFFFMYLRDWAEKHIISHDLVLPQPQEFLIQENKYFHIGCLAPYMSLRTYLFISTRGSLRTQVWLSERVSLFLTSVCCLFSIINSPPREQPAFLCEQGGAVPNVYSCFHLPCASPPGSLKIIFSVTDSIHLGLNDYRA